MTIGMKKLQIRVTQEGEENVDENSNEEVSDRGVANTDGGEQERRYQCKFCIHSFDVYSAYIIHVESNTKDGGIPN